MGPRKRSKPNPKAETEPNDSSPLQENPSSIDQQNTTEAESVGFGRVGEEKKVYNTGTSRPHSTKSWYGGTWPRGNKTAPVAQIAKIGTSAATELGSEVVATAPTHTQPLSCTLLRSSPAYQKLGSSSRSLPLAAKTTKINITSDTLIPANATAKEAPDRDQAVTSNAGKELDPANGAEPDVTTSSSDKKRESQQKDLELASNVNVKPPFAAISPRDSASWLAWFKSDQAKPLALGNSQSAAETKQDSGPVNSSPQTNVAENGKSESAFLMPRRNSEPTRTVPEKTIQDKPKSWLSLWNNTNAQSKSGSMSTKSASGNLEIATAELGSESHDGQIIGLDKHDIESASRPSLEVTEPPKSTAWAFWSKDTGSKKTDGAKEDLALAGSPSRSKLERKPEKDIVENNKGVPNTVGKRQRPKSLEVLDDTGRSQSATDTSKKEDKVEHPALAAKDAPFKVVASQTKREAQNLLLPSFKGTYYSVSRPGLLQQLSRWLPFAYLKHEKHVEIVSTPPRIKRALAIGVHGYFPAPLVRSLLGQPTGTSIRFANSAASAIQKWTQIQGYSCEVEKVALEGEGKIAERIDLLWKLMLAWIDKIRKADFVMVACHSQGCPVALILVAKLIAFGCVSSARIGVCAMAGINLGPFPDYKSRWMSGTAGELFDFAKPDSKVSKDYETALDVVLRFGVKIVYVGSIDDQLVSLEVSHEPNSGEKERDVLMMIQSSTFGPIVHPYIYRAVFIDGRVHAPDFITHLVGFALKLRNLGISDHGLIRELSSPLAGSLYGGEGHSRIYEDESVYYLAVEHALETTTLGVVPMQVQRDGSGSSQNPYILPFAMRGVIEEEFVRTELYGEITELIRQFDDWRPSSKVLKDVKFRLEGVRSKL
ncbi:MAG: hypothetical protein Q9164_000294 [Protoblastenia rupestris]